MSDSPEIPSRDDILTEYLSSLPFDPYPVQEEALLAWFACEQGVLLCAPTGTGKTLIAEAALYEALHSGKTAYYTTPLIALTEQKFRELQKLAVKWGFKESDVGLVTGNRRENPDARILVVVAEILLNRLLHNEAFDFTDVATVVMDEFHSFSDRERGVVWELSLELLPPHVRVLLLSATIGGAPDFIRWLRTSNDRRVELVQSDERKVPLTYQWVGDQTLTEHVESMAAGTEDERFTPALVFCFNRDMCWSVAEHLKGKNVIDGDRKTMLANVLAEYDFSDGAGPKLKSLLQRGVGVHHAGLLPKYRRIVEELFQKKLLSVATCTETLAAGINLPARSVVLPEIVKGPPDKKRIIEPSSAHQIFGRAGRPQFDSQGFVFVLAPEDDVKLARWQKQYDQIPENTKDPKLRSAKKKLKKKMPRRQPGKFYWNEEHFIKLREAPPGRLESQGPLPWRLLAYMLDASPDVDRIRKLVGRRLMDPKRLSQGAEQLDRMLLTLWRGGYVRLEPTPPPSAGPTPRTPRSMEEVAEKKKEEVAPPPEEESTFGGGLLGDMIAEAQAEAQQAEEERAIVKSVKAKKSDVEDDEEEEPPYKPEFAYPKEELERLTMFRSVNPLYGVFLINQLGAADQRERIQAMESVLELPRSVGKSIRVPRQRELPPGPLAMDRLDPTLLRLGLATAEQLLDRTEEEEEEIRDRGRKTYDEPPVRVLTFADKLQLLFNHDFPAVHGVRIVPVWAAGEVIEFGDFNNYITSKSLQKQEGIIFRHLLRMILLVGEFAQLTPPDLTDDQWREALDDISGRLTEICRRVDPNSTETSLQMVQNVGEVN